MYKMGAAQSKNVARSVTEISNYVSQSTTANTNQVQNLTNEVSFKDCIVKLDKDLNVNSAATFIQKNNQITNALQNADVRNNVKQAAMQTAKSLVGTMGIGYASASNETSQFINSSNSIINALSTSANQMANAMNRFECIGSWIQAENLNINFSSNGEFLSEQAIKQDQVAAITNDITQSVTQVASATVEGMTGFLIALAIIIAAIGYSISKPLSSGSAKIGMAFVMVFVVALVLAFSYIRKAPPFFGEPLDCSPTSDLGGCSDACVDLEYKENKIEQPPLRYLYPITARYNGSDRGNLIQFVAASIGRDNPDNGGYNGAVAASIQARLNSEDYLAYARMMGVPSAPNVLIVTTKPNGQYNRIPNSFRSMNPVGTNDTTSSSCTPSIAQVVPGSQKGPENCNTQIDPDRLDATTSPELAIANLNTAGWNNYLDGIAPPLLNNGQDSALRRQLYARFVLNDILNIADMNIYADPNGLELVRYNDANGQNVVRLARDAPGDMVYRYIPTNPPSGNWANGLYGGGRLLGTFGYCENRVYTFQKFMRKIGGWILLSIVLLFLMYIAYQYFAMKKIGSGTVPESKPK